MGSGAAGMRGFSLQLTRRSALGGPDGRDGTWANASRQSEPLSRCFGTTVPYFYGDGRMKDETSPTRRLAPRRSRAPQLRKDNSEATSRCAEVSEGRIGFLLLSPYPKYPNHPIMGVERRNLPWHQENGHGPHYRATSRGAFFRALTFMTENPRKFPASSTFSMT